MHRQVWTTDNPSDHYVLLCCRGGSLSLAIGLLDPALLGWGQHHRKGVFNDLNGWAHANTRRCSWRALRKLTCPHFWCQTSGVLQQGIGPPSMTGGEREDATDRGAAGRARTLPWRWEERWVLSTLADCGSCRNLLLPTRAGRPMPSYFVWNTRQFLSNGNIFVFIKSLRTPLTGWQTKENPHLADLSDGNVQRALCCLEFLLNDQQQNMVCEQCFWRTSISNYVVLNVVLWRQLMCVLLWSLQFHLVCKHETQINCEVSACLWDREGLWLYFWQGKRYKGFLCQQCK